MKPYPHIAKNDLSGIATVVNYITRQREIDILDRNNLNSTFIFGRKVAKIPTGSSDVALTDRIGDISFQDDYVYYLFDNAGTAEWRRIAAGTW